MQLHSGDPLARGKAISSDIAVIPASSLPCGVQSMCPCGSMQPSKFGELAGLGFPTRPCLTGKVEIVKYICPMIEILYDRRDGAKVLAISRKR